MHLDIECRKKDDEAISLKRELERIDAEIHEKRFKRDQVDLDNKSLVAQNGQ